MTFLNPTLALFALAAIAIPIAIHFLLRRKRSPIPFGAMQFLLAAYRTQRKRLQLEQLLLLLLRCAIVALLGFAVGRPLWGALRAGITGGPTTTIYVVDTGLAALTTDAAGNTALDRAAQVAKASLAQLDSTIGDRAALVITSPQTSPAGGIDPLVIVPATPDLRAVERAIDALRASDAQASIPAALAAARALAADANSSASGSTRMVLLSELRTGSLPGNRAGADPFATPLPALPSSQSPLLSLAAPLVALQPASNIAIADVQPLRPVALLRAGSSQQPVAARVRLVRFGPNVQQAQTVTVQLWAQPLASSLALPAAPDATAAARFEAGSTTATITPTIPLRATDTASPHTIVAKLAPTSPDVDAIASDNMLAAPLSVQSQLTVAIVSAPSSSASASSLTGSLALSSADWLSLALAPSASPGSLSADSDVLVRMIAPGELTSVISQGGSLPAALADVSAIIVCQPTELAAQAWQTLARARAAGKPLIIVPPDLPPTTDAPLGWANAMSEQLALSWTLTWTPPTSPSTLPPANSPQGFSDTATPQSQSLLPTTTLNAEADPLALLRAELPSLTRNVKFFHFLTLQAPAASAPRVILSLEGNKPLLVASDSATSAAPVLLWLAAPTLTWTDLPARPLMVPLVQELLRQVAARSDRNQTLIAGNPPQLAPADAIADARVVLASSSAADAGQVVPLATGSGIATPLMASGIWALRSGSGSTRSYAFAAPALTASDTTLPAPAALTSWLAAPGWQLEDTTTPQTSVAQPTKGRTTAALSARNTRLSFVLLSIALALLLVETAVARILSHAKPTGVSRDGAVVPAMPPLPSKA